MILLNQEAIIGGLLIHGQIEKIPNLVNKTNPNSPTPIKLKATHKLRGLTINKIQAKANNKKAKTR